MHGCRHAVIRRAIGLFLKGMTDDGGWSGLPSRAVTTVTTVTRLLRAANAALMAELGRDAAR